MATFFKKIQNTVKYWYLPLIVGILFVTLGFYTLASPLASYVALSVLFSVTFFVSGVIETIFSISNRKEMDNWGWSLFFGLVNLTVGLLLIINTDISMVTLPFYVGFVILFRSIAGISYALDLKNYGVLDWGNLMVIAVLGIILSFMMLFSPAAGGMTIVIWTGMSIIMMGIFSIYLSVKLRELHKHPGKVSEELIEKWQKLQDEITSQL